ncbi:peptidoglycan-binding domain-containing protein [Tumidithrix elongata RA019]|uniref:Peptidoglycan-binding domain-containing protein n=1 Tax=Tumidithrix elongata BACA0141 TaxID=2716417 RepID=A0AAW9Q6I8_9CYAN|nr:peptidoglycan-binding domain-containing protein [Tumidithrix elongata RA019]
MAHAELYKGDSSEEVTLLQTLLGINADGVFGDQTEAAVIKFQTEHGLDADGIVGARTWEALEAKKASSVIDTTGKSFGQIFGGIGNPGASS